jgi:hypothetical protein
MPLYRHPSPGLNGNFQTPTGVITNLILSGSQVAAVIWTVLTPYFVPIGSQVPQQSIRSASAYIATPSGSVTAYGCVWNNTDGLLVASGGVATPTSLAWVTFPLSWHGLANAPAYVGVWVPSTNTRIQAYSSAEAATYWNNSTSGTPGTLPVSGETAITNGIGEFLSFSYGTRMIHRHLGKSTHP